MPLAKVKSRAHRDPLMAIIVSVIAASVLVVYPLSYDLSSWRPLWMLMVMLFWVMCQPTWCGIWFAFGMGVFTDLLVGAPIGMNALGFSIITFVARFLTRERRILTFFNLWMISLMAIVAQLLMTWLLQIMGGFEFSLARHWLPVISSVLCWPLVYYSLRKWRI